MYILSVCFVYIAYSGQVENYNQSSFPGTIEPCAEVLSREMFYNTPKLSFCPFMLLNYENFLSPQSNYMNP